jgi:hypothetical protein
VCQAGAVDLTAAPDVDPSQYSNAYVDLHGSRTRVLLLAGSPSSMTTCSLSSDAPGWFLTLDYQALGTYAIDADTVRVWNTVDAISGTISFDGYAEGGLLCGSVDATFADGGKLAGTFTADVYCD